VGSPAAGGAYSQARSKTLAIYEDMIYYTAPDSHVIALDAQTGETRWELPMTGPVHTSVAVAGDWRLATALGIPAVAYGGDLSQQAEPQARVGGARERSQAGGLHAAEGVCSARCLMGAGTR